MILDLELHADDTYEVTMPESPATIALRSMLTGLETRVRLHYQSWEYAFWRRWSPEVMRDPHTTEGIGSIARARRYLAEREVDITKPMTCIEAYGFYAHHHLLFKNEKHLANYVADQRNIPRDDWAPTDDEDWNRIEDQQWKLDRDNKADPIQIDMGANDV
jgi:hypothetical protein